MQFFVDPAGTLDVVAKAELALDDLTAKDFHDHFMGVSIGTIH
jgi:hypothetical protein